MRYHFTSQSRSTSRKQDRPFSPFEVIFRTSQPPPLAPFYVFQTKYEPINIGFAPNDGPAFSSKSAALQEETEGGGLSMPAAQKGDDVPLFTRPRNGACADAICCSEGSRSCYYLVYGVQLENFRLLMRLPQSLCEMTLIRKCSAGDAHLMFDALATSISERLDPITCIGTNPSGAHRRVSTLKTNHMNRVNCMHETRMRPRKGMQDTRTKVVKRTERVISLVSRNEIHHLLIPTASSFLLLLEDHPLQLVSQSDWNGLLGASLFASSLLVMDGLLLVACAAAAGVVIFGHAMADRGLGNDILVLAHRS